MQTTFTAEKMMNRAADLFTDGYTVEPYLLGLFAVYNPTGARYLVDGVNRTCTCKSFSRGMYRTNSGRCTCKHLKGLCALVRAQAARYEARRTHAPEVMANRLDSAAWELYANLDFCFGGEMHVPGKFIGLIAEEGK